MAALPPEIAERLGYYVYILVDPRTGQPFYVGKGTGARLLSHGFEASQLSQGPGEHAKLARIREIRGVGLEPRADVVKHGMREEDAFLVEAALIDCLPDLTNKVRGAGTDTGRVALSELISQFAAPPLGSPQTPALLIKLGDWHLGPVPMIPTRRGGGYYPGITPQELYDATRCWWRVSPDRLTADGIEHVVPIHRGVTRAVYHAARWFPAPDQPRWGFEGAELRDGPVFEEYVGEFGKRVAFSKGAQNPVAYFVPGRGLQEPG